MVRFGAKDFVRLLEHPPKQMTRRRWIAEEFSGNRAAITGAHAEHLSRALRVRAGEKFDIVTGSNVREGVVTVVDDSRVEFELGNGLPASVSPVLSLVLAIFKFDRMEWAVEKCIELGVTKIIPVIAQRTEPRLATAASKRVERWRRIALQVSEQSRRITLPDISQPTKMKEILEFSAGARVLLSESEREMPLKDAIARTANEVVLAVGPEGGWTEPELKMFRDAGWTSASLGNTVLRCETAAIAAVAVVLSRLQ